MQEKNRLDVALVERGLVPSRERGRALIMAGVVYVGGQKALKAGQTVKPDDVIEVRENVNPFVSRGGLKLQKAMREFPIRLADSVCIDVGASTGGFTDCMLQSGAKKVYAVDVGYGQLAWKLRTDPRVVNLERTNFRHCTAEQIPDAADFASVDVSFISLRIILPVLHTLLRDGGEAVCLVKPQFEAGRENVGKKGVVRDETVHETVVREIMHFAADAGFAVLGLTYSPIKGPEGNIEYLLHLRKAAQGSLAIEDEEAVQLVRRSHEALGG